MSDTLVLNTSNEPIDFIAWEDAMRLWYQGKVEVLIEYGTRFVRCVTGTLNMPAVIKYVRGKFKGKHRIKFTRQNIYARDKGHCQYCNQKVSLSNFTYDHVIPKFRNGRTCWENVVVACVPCNQKKSNKTLFESKMVLLNKPEKPDYLKVNRMTFKKGMPDEWMSFLYWTEEITQD